ncbi:putative spermidine/putrescine transport system permease protein [Aminobacter aminovorans]|uniref:Spermidine/putrescine transport system permease protein PotB n=1 Tax=Aminobacter aminovorans TaxID=83263 RepID=A0A381IKK1_AMIAI|nr:ABC transporter permease [Aminobacter aminovorans]TCS25076.1 putative spermidine/putrescine transport system permease protein [Aminobacter aminovorans]SUY28417.1 Spermidine/putrescine transport system permease protein PotB [Aminobacter aminovorans]
MHAKSTEMTVSQFIADRGDDRLESASGKALSARLRAGQRRKIARALTVAGPLLVFLLLAFVVPLASMLWRAVDNGDVSASLRNTSQALAAWDGTSLPDVSAFAALANDILDAKSRNDLPRLATRLNSELGGFRSLLLSSARKMEAVPADPRMALLAIDKRWGDLRFWVVLNRESARFTIRNVLSVLDLEKTAEGSVQSVPKERRVYLDYLARTLSISLTVSLACTLIGFPMARLMAEASSGVQKLLVSVVLLSFWTSLLVRTAAWVVLLQKEGIANSLLLMSGVLHDPAQLIFNRTGVIVAMTHVLLPFFALPLYGVMKGVDRSLLRAAASLGATPFRTFLSVYLPLTMPGVVAGWVMVFVLANGFYITPALVGGNKDQMISALIADFAIGRGNWGMASALAILLLVCIGIVFLAAAPLLRRKSLNLGRG